MRRPWQRGFTLLEMLIAIAIFALIGLGTYRMLDTVLRSDAVTRAHEQDLRELTRAFASLERDLLQASPRPIRDAYGDERGALLGEEGEGGTSASLELTRAGWRNPLGAQRAQLQRVHWQLRGHSLERDYWAVLDQAVDSPAQRQQVLQGVTALGWRYLDQEGEWQSRWPPLSSDADAEQARRSLPQAIELTLSHQRYGELRRLLRLPDLPQAPDAGGAAPVPAPEAQP